ncbi:gluconokinase isoform X2 [Prosopis cineraria]|uniref:gluconokinase isoform X2 n=1 Tax=Prosopis cineraria TaxID=364024 RepID=UPI0024107888|nr:gluconokinase isoform X2 [Prosopis cineraria]
MASSNGSAVVIGGVSGSGKTTIGQMLAKELNYSYLDADDFHSQSNKDKMRMGIPLLEEDRIPWLNSLRNILREYLTNRKDVILSCSALKKQYREILRSADPNYKWGSHASTVSFVLLDVPAHVLRDRLNEREAKGSHFMPASLLQSQLDLLEIDEFEGILKVDATSSPKTIVNAIKDMRQI